MVVVDYGRGDFLAWRNDDEYDEESLMLYPLRFELMGVGDSSKHLK